VRPLVVDHRPGLRGGQHQALLLLRGLAGRAATPPELITLRDSLLARRAKDAASPCVGVPTPGCRRLAAALAIRLLVRTRRVDIVHSNEPHALSSAWLARAHRSVPLVRVATYSPPAIDEFVSLARYRAAARIIAIFAIVKKSVLAKRSLPMTMSK